MASGTNRSHPTRKIAESRVERLQRQRESRRKFAVREPGLNREAELKAALAYVAVLVLIAGALAGVLITGFLNPESDIRAVLSFALGLVAACALASSLTFLITIRHRLLLMSSSAAMIAAGALILGIAPLEGIAKIVFAATAGLWISLMLTSIGQVFLISILIIGVDFYSVLLGPTKKMVESGGPWIEYLTVNLPVFGVDAVSRLGMSDIIFFSLFLGVTVTFGLRRVLTALAMGMSFIITMAVGVTLDTGVPALPLLSTFFILSNADLLYRRLA